MLAYSSDEAGPEAIYILNMATGQTRKLTPPFVGSEDSMAWSPDGQEIAFQTDIDTDTDANTYVADVATGKFRQVGPTLFEPGRPSWGPDSNILALSNYRAYSDRGGGLYGAGSNEIYTINVNTGQTTWYDPYPYNSQSIRVLDDGPVWSPNGKYMAYILNDVLYVLPVHPDGSPARRQRQLTMRTRMRSAGPGTRSSCYITPTAHCG